jgi:transcriptional regulator with XRE-family HTH domain
MQATHPGEGKMTPAQRIRVARRHCGLSQASLAKLVGVQRSAVSHWEAANEKSPNANHLYEIAIATGISFEWLATGRGAMALSNDVRLDSIAAVDAMLVDDAIELRLIKAFRGATTKSRVALVEIAEQLVVLRTGRVRPERTPAALMPAHAARRQLDRPRNGSGVLPD